MGATAAIGVTAIGTGVSAYGQLKSGSETNKMFQRNAQFAEYQAQDAEARGKIDERKMRQLTEKTIGAQRAGLAGQGVDVNTGSALDVQADAAYLGELDALTIRTNAAKEAWGYRTQSQNLIQRGKNAKREGELGAFNTILGAGSSLLLSSYGGGFGGSAPKSRSSAQEMSFNPQTAGK